MKKLAKVLLVVSMLSTVFSFQQIEAQRGAKLTLNVDNIKAFSDPNHPISNAVDGDNTTIWKSIPYGGYGDDATQKKETRMYDHNRYITITLDGTYDLDEIKIANNTGSFNNYYIYASEDGSAYDKIVSKTDNNVATDEGDVHQVSKRASYLRLNMAYNSATFETNLAEIEVYGTKVSDTVEKPEKISVSSWEGSTYQKEWNKFEGDKKYANNKTIQEVKELVGRVIGNDWTSKFRFELRSDSSGKDVFEVEDGNGIIIIRGNDGVSLASGFNYYLKNYAMIDYNPLFDSNVNMTSLPKVGKKIVKETQYDVRYALNFCTYSYTMAFWGWEEYQEFIDWAAMNGVNLMLDIVGQEEVLRQTLLKYNFTDEEIKDYIAGPGYFAWFYMQNLYSFGGPLPDSWFEQRVELGRKMHDRMQAFGIDPVIQGFSGQVPLTFDDKNEGAVLTPIDEWPSFTRPAIIKTYLSEEEIAAGKKDYFVQMSKDFYDAQKNVYGDVSNYYAADPFHEGGNTAGLNITDIFKTVQTEMLKANEDAIWVLQQWQGNLNHSNLSGLVKKDQALALDLQTDKNPSYGVMEQYDVPWVWGMLHNFGGRMGLDGEINAIASRPAETKVDENASGMVGIGITPEALENSPVVYELLFDMTWSSDPIDPQKWVEKYAQRRAGGNDEKLQEAWGILTDTAYSVKKEYFQGAAETVINARPGMGFSSASTWGHSLIPYEKTELDKALQLLIDNYDEFSASPAYRYDLADVSEQVLCNAAVEYHKLMVAAYNKGDSAEFKRVSKHYLELIELSDKILQSSEEFMLGTWIDDSRTMIDGADDWTKDLFEFNARALVTTWGGERSGSLKDYSNRKWAGLTDTFYKERWSMWISNRQAELDKTAKDPIAEKAESDWFMWEWQWVNRKSDDGFSFSTTPEYSNLKELSQKAVDSYSATSLKDFGGSAESDANIIEGKLFTTNPDTSEDLRKKLTDGSTATEWKGTGNEEYTFTLDLEGTYEINSIEILLQQLAVDFVYNYKAEIFDPNTNAWQEVEANVSDDTMSSQTVITLNKDNNKTASKIRMTMKTRDASSRPLVVTQFKIMGKPISVTNYYNVAKGLVAESTRKTQVDSDIARITDENTTNLWNTEWVSNTDAMYPTTVTLDLKKSYEVTSVELYLEKVGLPYKFKVVTIDALGVETIVLDKTDNSSTLDERVYKIPVNNKINKVKVVYEGTTKQGAASLASPAMSELRVLSLTPPSEAKKVNHALNKTVKVSSINPYGTPKAEWVNDGNTSTVWSYNGTGDPNGNAEIDLEGTYLIDTINLTYKKEDYSKYYKFDIYVIDKQDQKKVIYTESSEGTPNKTSYSIPVGMEIKKLGVEYKGKKAGTDGWFDIAELEAMGNQVDSSEVIFGNGAIQGVKTTSNHEKTVDGKKDTFVNGIKDKEIVYDLGGNYYLDEAIFTFEKAELGLRYIVYAESIDGTRSVVLDASSTNAVIENRDVAVKVKRDATKIVFKHLGNNGNGPAYLAEPRLYEATFMKGTPKNILENSSLDITAANAIKDGDLTTSYTMAKNETIVFTCAKATDINILQMFMKASSSSKVYTLEYFDANKSLWIPMFDSSSQTGSSNDYLIVLEESIYTNKIRLTANGDHLEINELKAYEIDMTQPLISYIKEVKEIVASKKYEDNNGSYTPEAKAKLEAVLLTVEEKLENGMSSAEVQLEITNVKIALNEFLKKGVIYIDRGDLLSAMNYGQFVLDMAKQKTRSIDTDVANLEVKLVEADVLYKEYKATQTKIKECTIELKKLTQLIYNNLNVDEKFDVQVKRAESLLNTIVGDKHGQVSQEVKNILMSQLTALKTDYESGNVDKLYLINLLEAANINFEAEKIVVDKANLLVALGAMNGLNKGIYDFTTWKALKGAIDNAQLIYDTEAVSQIEINNAITKIDDAKSVLVLLDKTQLRQLIDKVSSLNENEFTSETWVAFTSTLRKANDLYALDELTQIQVDNMHKDLTTALNGLVKKQPKPEQPKPEEPTTPDVERPVLPEIDRPNSGATTPNGKPTPTVDNNQPNTKVEDDTKEPTDVEKDTGIEDEKTPQAAIKTPTNNTNNWMFAGLFGMITVLGCGCLFVFKKRVRK